MKTQSRKTLFLIAAVCLAPVVLSYLFFYVFPPDKTMNYGELITPPVPFQDAGLTGPDGEPFSIASLRGKWVLLHANYGGCDESCLQLVYYMRQARTAQGPDMDRIERLFVITDDSEPEQYWLKDYAGMKIAHGQPPLPAPKSPRLHIYLIDPMGNIILRYPERPEPKRIIKDLARLMKYSNVDRGAK